MGQPITRQPFSFMNEPTSVYVWTDDHGFKSGGLNHIATVDDNIPYEDVQKFDLQVNRLAQEWHIPGASHIVATSPGRMYMTEQDAPFRIVAYDRATGRADWNWDINAERAEGEKVTHITRYLDPRDELRTILTIDETNTIVAYRMFGNYPLSLGYILAMSHKCPG